VISAKFTSSRCGLPQRPPRRLSSNGHYQQRIFRFQQRSLPELMYARRRLSIVTIRHLLFVYFSSLSGFSADHFQVGFVSLTVAAFFVTAGVIVS
jgi:hypothetical protein